VVIAEKRPDLRNYTVRNLKKINYHISDLSSVAGMKPGIWIKNINYDDFNEFTASEAEAFLDSLTLSFRSRTRNLTLRHDSLYKQISSNRGEAEFIQMREKNYNQNLADIVLNNMTTSKIYDAGDRYIQKADPIFMNPGSRSGRAHFYAPYKQIGSMKISTLLFNVVVIWIMVMVLFITLYYNVLKRFIAFLESLKLPILRKYGRELLQI